MPRIPPGKWKLAASEAESANSFQVLNDIHKQKMKKRVKVYYNISY